MFEDEKHSQSCCFTGHRPEKLQHDETYYRIALADAIHGAIDHGYRTFISGMARGIDIWAAEEVLACKREIPDLRLFCALPYPDFEKGWSADWQRRYQAILHAADLVKVISDPFSLGSYQRRNEWMIHHAEAQFLRLAGDSLPRFQDGVEGIVAMLLAPASTSLQLTQAADSSPTPKQRAHQAAFPLRTYRCEF